ncbi:MAG: DUF6526 family protein [Bacteroidota bacterium]
MKQNYQNHKRYYTPHHFIFLPLLGILGGIAVYQIFTDKMHQLEWALFGICIFCILYLTLMLRQHYALGNQNRIVRLEFRLRYFEMMGETSKKVEQQLSFSQIAALRFAPDEEFMLLLDRTLQEKLNSDEIKRSIKNWEADAMRL